MRPLSPFFAGISLVLLAAVACGPKEARNDRSKVANSDDANQQSRRNAFSEDDINKVDINLAPSSFEPWSLGTPRLIGTFPDSSQGLIRDDVTWTVSGTNSDKLLFDTKTGEVAAREAGSYQLSAKWGKFNPTIILNFAYQANSALSSLPNPLAFKALRTSGTTAKLTWNPPANFVTNYYLAYIEGTTAPSSCAQPGSIITSTSTSTATATSTSTGTSTETAAVVYIDPSTTSENVSEYVITGLNALKSYSFKICSAQKIEIGAKYIARLSTGIVATISDSAAP